MEDTRIVKDAKILAAQKWGEQAKVEILTEGSDEYELLFNYFDDELHFTPDDFIGKTVSAAFLVKHQKDVIYLRS